eukprot:TRINITY_DN5149_c0_g1_i1.p1 TRINITY_DN5149_c0_g1~~TRINITY_DN5149_c0_g1_i1.p1  ORF type:complete len:1190 (-),score=209.03 TRINITY_DN5149_c0_g1_i1:45-3401(-)
MDGEGNLYTRAYRVWTKNNTRKTSREKTPGISSPLSGRKKGSKLNTSKLAKVIKSFPNVEDPSFTSFSDYEQAVILWEKRAEKKLGCLKLPNVIGRCYHRPKYTASKISHDDTDEISEELSNREKKATASSQGTEENEDGLGTEENVDELDFTDDEFAKYVLSTDPWDATLAPPEPDPDNYKCYEDYEAACLRWGHVCSQTMTFIPPHPNQLTQLLLLPTADEKDISLTRLDDQDAEETEIDNDESNKKTQRRKEIASRLGNDIDPYYSSWGAGTTTNTDGDFSCQLKPIKEENEVLSPWVRYPKQVKDTIEDKIADLLKKRQATNASMQRYNAPSRCIFHGVDSDALPPNDRLGFPPMRSLPKDLVLPQSEIQGVVANSDALPLLLNCTENKKKNIVPSRFHLVDDIAPVNIKYMQIPEYRDILLKALRGLRYRDRNLDLQSWYHPSLPEFVHQQHTEELDQIVTKKTYDNPSMLVRATLQAQMYLDRYSDHITQHANVGEQAGDELVWGEGKLTYLLLVLNHTSTKNISEILQLFYDAAPTNTNTRSKIAFFVQQVLQSNKGKEIVQKVTESYDIISLYHIAYSMNYFTALPSDVFEFPHALVALICSERPKMKSLFDLIFALYYLRLIKERIAEEKFLYLGVNAFIPETINEQEDLIAKTLAHAKRSVLNGLLTYAKHFSAQKSGLALFAILQLLTTQAAFPSLSEKFDMLVSSVATMANSKLSHVRYGARRIFVALTSIPKWKELICTFYRENPDKLLVHLFGTEEPYEAGFALLVSEFCLQMLESAAIKLRTKSAPEIIDEFSFIIKGSVLKDILHAVSLNLQNGQSDLPVQRNVEIVARQAKLLYNLELVSGVADVKTKKGKRSSAMLSQDASSHTGLQAAVFVSPSDLAGLLSTISKSSKSESCYAAKAKLLDCLRYLLKPQDTFDFIRKENDFYKKLAVFCKDGQHLQFNKAAWKLFYSIVKYHTGVIDYLQGNSKIFVQFLGAIGTENADITIIHALRCTRKLFTMFTVASEAVQKGKTVPRADLKALEKDVRNVVKLFLNKHLFIKSFMVYKRYGGHSGMIFQEVAKLYHVLATEPACAKLLKTCDKTAEYKIGVSKLSSMFTTEEVL